MVALEKYLEEIEWNKIFFNINITDIMDRLLYIIKILHDNGIVHLNINPSNLLFNGSVFQVIDYGLSCIECDDTCHTEYVDTKFYWPIYIDNPIGKNEDFKYKMTIDYFSIGITICELLFGDMGLRELIISDQTRSKKIYYDHLVLCIKILDSSPFKAKLEYLTGNEADRNEFIAMVEHDFLIGSHVNVGEYNSACMYIKYLTNYPENTFIIFICIFLDNLNNLLKINEIKKIISTQLFDFYDTVKILVENTNIKDLRTNIRTFNNKELYFDDKEFGFYLSSGGYGKKFFDIIGHTLYKQKYLKYKQKYIQLNKLLNTK
jgi:serine/threonine protein kinase